MKNNSDINIEKHLGLVHLCCQRFKGRGASYDDIFQCGCIGLAKASKNFDASKEVKFSTYAVPMILGEIKSFFRDNSPIKVSRNLKEISAKIRLIEEKFSIENSRLPTLKELSDSLGIEKDQILEAMESSKPLASLDEINQEGREPQINFNDDNINLKISIKDALKSLDLIDKNLVYLRFFEYKTQSQTAKELGKNQVWVSRREKVILKVLRDKLT